MEYNKESFKKALKECGIIRWENHFEKVVKAYLKAETEQLTIPVVVKQSELFTCKLKGGKECCSFKSKDYTACVQLRKCEFASI